MKATLIRFVNYFVWTSAAAMAGCGEGGSVPACVRYGNMVDYYGYIGPLGAQLDCERAVKWFPQCAEVFDCAADLSASRPYSPYLAASDCAQMMPESYVERAPGVFCNVCTRDTSGMGGNCRESILDELECPDCR